MEAQKCPKELVGGIREGEGAVYPCLFRYVHGTQLEHTAKWEKGRSY